MANNIVAYAGIECFDLILYQARILSKLGRKVLIMENRAAGAFYYTIPRPFGIDGEINPVTYRRIDFAVTSLPEGVKENYDDIFITHDFQIPEEEYNRVVFSTDLLLHHMKMVSSLFIQSKCQNKSLLVRNIIEVNVNTKYLFGQLGKNISIDYIDFDELDYENAILCQHNQTMQFVGLSRKTKKFLLKEIGLLCPEVETRAINKAYKAAQGGR